jgi:hypothetical protein
MEPRLTFIPHGRMFPYIRKVFTYANDSSEGVLEYDGIYYMSDPLFPEKQCGLPAIEFLCVKQEGEANVYVIEVYRHECTDGRHRLYFRVIEKIKHLKDMYRYIQCDESM